jgi:apolipoprotein N-acyltransferase
MSLAFQYIYPFLKRLFSWQAHLLAFVMGAIATLALPPVEWWFALIPAFCMFYLLVDAVPFKTAFGRGWWFGLGHFTTGLYWITFSLGVELEKFFWLIPFALLGLPAIVALYTGFFAGIFSRLNLLPVPKWAAFAVLWAVVEYGRGILFTGFPWNLICYSWMPVPEVLQLTSLIGAYGLSLLTVMFVTLPILLMHQFRKTTFAIAGAFLLVFFWGHCRLKDADNKYVPNITLRLVQPCIEQKLKMDPLKRAENFLTHLQLSRLPAKQPITHIIWPEAAVSSFLEQSPERRQILAALIPAEGAVILGAPRFERQVDGTPLLWNGLLAVNAQGEVEAAYSKSHLVPFGEYVPLRWLFPSFVKKVTAGSIDFSAGKGLQTLQIDHLPPFSSLVCYEGIFPGQVVAKEGRRPEWLLNLTNDAWFGTTSGPYQHLAITRLRAIEEGLPLVRVANNGISAVIDPYGRVLRSLPLNRQGVLDIQLPVALAEPTLYARFGNFIFFIMLGVIALAVLASTRYKTLTSNY